jgi:hypothetical protein
MLSRLLAGDLLISRLLSSDFLIPRLLSRMLSLAAKSEELDHA